MHLLADRSIPKLQHNVFSWDEINTPFTSSIPCCTNLFHLPFTPVMMQLASTKILLIQLRPLFLCTPISTGFLPRKHPGTAPAHIQLPEFMMSHLTTTSTSTDKFPSQGFFQGEICSPLAFACPPLGYAENSILHVNQL